MRVDHFLFLFPFYPCFAYKNAAAISRHCSSYLLFLILNLQINSSPYLSNKNRIPKYVFILTFLPHPINHFLFLFPFYSCIIYKNTAAISCRCSFYFHSYFKSSNKSFRYTPFSINLANDFTT